ncbi:MAG: hypothetical protein RL681_658 [Candidatus Parcubacteria bacterium]|jgi:hypothetical protein
MDYTMGGRWGGASDSTGSCLLCAFAGLSCLVFGHLMFYFQNSIKNHRRSGLIGIMTLSVLMVPIYVYFLLLDPEIFLYGVPLIVPLYLFIASYTFLSHPYFNQSG